MLNSSQNKNGAASTLNLFMNIFYSNLLKFQVDNGFSHLADGLLFKSSWLLCCLAGDDFHCISFERTKFVRNLIVGIFC